MGENVTFAQVVARKTSLNTAEPENALNNNNNNSNPLTNVLIPANDTPLLPSTININNNNNNNISSGIIIFSQQQRPAGSESYADAVKSRSIKLDGVPVNNTTKVLSAFESFTNSTMQEQESVLSSWADDDQCFFDSIRISCVGEVKKSQEAQHNTNNNNYNYNNINNNNNNSVGGGGGGNRRGRGGRGWRFIDENNNNNNNNNNKNNNGGRRRRGGQHNNNNNNNNNKSGFDFRRAGGAEPPNLSGGRFASLK